MRAKKWREREGEMLRMGERFESEKVWEKRDWFEMSYAVTS